MAMAPQTVSDILLLTAPAFGIIANVTAQFLLVRAARQKLLTSIVGGFFVGALLTAALMSIALVESPATALDALALAIVVMAIYNAAGFCHFCFVNLGETSLRIRILQMVMEAPQGLDLSEILDAYNDQHLIAIRLRRIADNGQARLSNGIFYPRRSLLFAASTILELLKRMLYGRPRQASGYGG